MQAAERGASAWSQGDGLGNLTSSFTSALANGKSRDRLMQFLELRSESSVSVNPKPRGLTTPAATTATRAVCFSG